MNQLKFKSSLIRGAIVGVLGIGVLLLTACLSTNAFTDIIAAQIPPQQPITEATDTTTVDSGVAKVSSASDTTPFTASTHKSGDKNLPLLTKQEIKNMLAASDPNKWPKNFYSSTPKLTSPQSQGSLNQQVLNLALARLNTMRRLCGVHDVSLDKGYTEAAQMGALLLAVNGKGLAHGLGSAPKGMSAATFKQMAKGNEALGKGNLSSFNPVKSVDEWVADPGNMPPAHRFWAISPWAGKVGFGYVETLAPEKSTTGYTGYTSLRACDTSARGAFDWDFVAWPAPGYFPLGDMFPTSHVANNSGPNTIYTSPWCILFPYNKQPGSPLVTLTRLRDGKTWKYYYSSVDPKYNTMSGMSYQTVGGLEAMSFTFYPNEVDHTYQDGDAYEVKVINASNQTVIQYTVEFFDPSK